MPHSLAQFATDLTKIAAGASLLQHEVMEKACRIVEKEAKRVIGTYDYGWAPLAEATRADRVAHGFPEDEPLLRTGEMRDSIEHRVEHEGLGMEVVGLIGTNNMVAVYQELGTRTIPPRSFLGEAAMHKEEEIHELFGAAMYSSVMMGFGLGVPHGIASKLAAVENAIQHAEHAVEHHDDNPMLHDLARQFNPRDYYHSDYRDK